MVQNLIPLPNSSYHAWFSRCAGSNPASAFSPGLIYHIIRNKPAIQNLAVESYSTRLISIHTKLETISSLDLGGDRIQAKILNLFGKQCLVILLTATLYVTKIL